MKIAVLVSGGVDSSVALMRLKADGHECHVFYLKIWLEEETAFLGDCPWEEDLAYVRELCQRLAVPLTIIPLQSAYYERVVDYVLKELREGRTPSPDILCNEQIKFGAFFDAIGPGYTKVASGHYANVAQEGGSYLLKCAKDSFKDQTYFLSRLRQDQLSRIVFPTGDLLKDEVRQLAHDDDLPNKDRKDSQGICFLGKIKYADFVRHYLGERPGPMISRESGRRMGEHRGYWFYTIGQRQGLGLSGGPWYVTGKDIEENTLYISNIPDQEERSRDRFEVGDLHWISGESPLTRDFRIKIRHGEDYFNGTLDLTGDNGRVSLDQTDAGIAAGQFATFYDQDTCLGSGIIR